MFWNFRQNNSGGNFVIDDNIAIGPQVWIEADNIDAAINKATSIGIYFNGVEDGQDCECCGDRWYVPYGDGEEKVKTSKYDFHWHDTVYVHNIDGTITRIKE